MNATNLKIIAVICMTLDHLSTYLGAPLPLRYIGRIAAVMVQSRILCKRKTVHIENKDYYDETDKSNVGLICIVA